MENETESKDNVYVDLLKKIGYTNPHSKYLLGILRKMASVEDARLMLALPAELAVLSQKTGLGEEEAYLTIQRRAREARVSIRQAAEAILAQKPPAA